MPDFTDRVVGCIVGGALGDAFAGPYEGQSNPATTDRPSPWYISDDTQLTLATCEAIVQAGGVDPQVIAHCFLRWYRSGRLTGLGSSTLKGLRDLDAGVHWALSGRRGEYAAGNGAAMRVAPLALILDPTGEESRQKIRDVCRITHHSDEAYAGAFAIASAIRLAFDGVWTPGDRLLARIAPSIPDTAVRDRIVELSEQRSSLGVREAAERYGAGGYVVESVPLALLNVEINSVRGIEFAIGAAVLPNADCDTIASLTGQIIGTSIGYRNLPKLWLERLSGKDEVESIACQFASYIDAAFNGARDG